jgi:hypothetical protein
MLCGLIHKPLQPQRARQQVMGSDALIMEEPEPMTGVHRRSIELQQALDMALGSRLVAGELKIVSRKPIGNEHYGRIAGRAGDARELLRHGSAGAEVAGVDVQQPQRPQQA